LPDRYQPSKNGFRGWCSANSSQLVLRVTAASTARLICGHQASSKRFCFWNPTPRFSTHLEVPALPHVRPMRHTPELPSDNPADHFRHRYFQSYFARSGGSNILHCMLCPSSNTPPQFSGPPLILSRVDCCVEHTDKFALFSAYLLSGSLDDILTRGSANVGVITKRLT
jgi:hypothetical protein